MADLEFICLLDDLKEKLSAVNEQLNDATMQFGVEISNALFPVLVSVSKNHSDRLTVLYNGAVNRERSADGIVFQRSSWGEEIPSTLVSFADPTLVMNDRMSIGWGQADGVLFAPEQYEKILTILRQVLEIPAPSRTLHYGSSAGGFQALATAAFDRESRVLCNNPQTDYSRYAVAWATNRALRIHGVDNRAAYLESENYPELAWRVEIPKLYEKVSYIPRNIRLLINTASKNDLEEQAGSFISGITEISNTDSNLGFEVYYYYNPTLGHNPLPKPHTIAEISAQLDGF